MPCNSPSQPPPTLLASHAHRFLFLRIKGGRGFSQYLLEDPAQGEELRVCGSFLGQRFESKPARAALDPALEASVLLRLPGGRNSTAADLAAGADRTIQLQVIRTCSPGTRESAGGCLLDWRRALVGGVGRAMTSTAELLLPVGGSGLGSGPLAPSGALELKLEVVPGPGAALEAPQLRELQQAEAQRDKAAAAALSARTRAWWADVTGSCPAARGRQVLLQAYGEDGVLRPVTAFAACPVLPGRSTPSPFHAARLVSLLRPREDSRVLAPAGSQCVCSALTVLASQQATGLERAVLLACLLRWGFSLDAWVCCGTDARGPHHWVWTRGQGGAFWEPITGRRYPADASGRPGGCPYITLDSVFGPDRVLCNVQPEGPLLAHSLQLEDAACWRELAVGPEDTPAPLGPGGRAAYPALSLQPPSVSGRAAEEQEEALEAAVGIRLGDYRSRELGVRGAMRLDEALGPLLMQALEAYEREALTGSPAGGTSEFQSGIKRAVPSGSTFHGVRAR